ncbi:Dipeptide transport system permease protein DppC [Pseudonocardia sp. Ae168_Ps1]|uniref:ABC transporter permease subunit n=1 Tax=unclassified Pseudonocardia TaxID=2619320 RepID=UPI00094AAB5D|nr:MULTISPECIES: ABC transporter permease subunit [unclassified Pseudonocardia]OLL74439.1 Dipeptide transport system permease protein DppC [Pseudonocardia sp. Ae150A_Ps1]OLL80419.1 Dipeptide transport system permease protein DppC [Pseudonocardia sp. Ae168_Ps1]OLL85454.1 Dipeptide transport system permease protein DppC [Pseudonocardia sp. Ae263_Ps1]OLL94519.1 Dipeptide transport system permease protein DppC [Pseudonocardia sp. Ae356_Ps1]
MSRATLGLALAGVPLACALLGPLLAPLLPADDGAGALLPPGPGHPLGTDALGRDVLTLALTGGTTVVGLTAGALLLSYLVAMPLGLVLAAARARWAATATQRVLDVLLVLPSLVVLLVLAGTGRRGIGWLLVAAAVLQLPAIVRLVRSAAGAPSRRVALETMAQNGEPWWRIHLVETGRFVAGPVLVDAGTRGVMILGLLASASFLGVGLPPDTVDWAVMIEQNSASLFLAPAALLVPATLLVALAAGTSLLVDRIADRTGAVT